VSVNSQKELIESASPAGSMTLGLGIALEALMRDREQRAFRTRREVDRYERLDANCVERRRPRRRTGWCVARQPRPCDDQTVGRPYDEMRPPTR
jgi:hypothetical protein